MATQINVGISKQSDLAGYIPSGLTTVKGGVPLWVGLGNGVNGSGWSSVSTTTNGMALTSDSTQANKVALETSVGVLDNAVDLTHLTAAAKPNSMAWAPAGMIAQTCTREDAAGATALVNGKVVLCGGAVLPRGVTVSNIVATIVNAGTGVLAHQWACLVDQSGNVLAKSGDLTTTAWAANTSQTFPLATGSGGTGVYTPVADIAVYLGFVVQFPSGTASALTGKVGGPGIHALTPIMVGTASSGLTTPASLGATVGAITGTGSLAWAYVT